MKRIGIWCLLFPALSAAAVGQAQSLDSLLGRAAPTIVSARMIADTTAVKQGTTLTVGVLFKIEPEWHIYWKNPGETGFATTVKWELDAVGGLFAETLYPAPVTFTGLGGVISYGYADEVLLMARIPVAELDPTLKEVELRAKARWLMCQKEECRDAKSEVSLKLPVGKGAPTNRDVFERYAAFLPKPGTPANVKLSLKPAEKGFVAEIALTPPEGGIIGESREPDAHKVFFFPEPIKGYESRVPEIPEPNAVLKTASGQLNGFRDPFVIRTAVWPVDKKTTGVPVVSGVLVQQAATGDGKLQTTQNNVVMFGE
jgi:DsbC/DsbD-like thiol-disulfide interchange protein